MKYKVNTAITPATQEGILLVNY